MKNPLSRLFTPDYEDNLRKTLEENLYNARRGLMIAIEAKQRADATLQYSETRVQSLTTALAEHKGANNVQTNYNNSTLDRGYIIPQDSSIKLQ